MSDAAVPPPLEFLVDQEGERFDVFLARRMPGLSRSQGRQLIDDGLALVDGSLERASYRLRFGEMVRVQPAAAPEPLAEAADIPMDVRYEDDDVLVINKQAGLTVHPAPGERESTLVSALLARYPQLRELGDALRPGLVHRLDRDTSGVMMVAKTAESQERLQAQIRERSVEKRYWAVAIGAPDPLEGAIDAPIGRDAGDPRKMAVVERGKASRTEYRVDERFTDSSLIDCKLITGRTHQIRVHLAAIGHPIVGDGMYGHRSDQIDRQALHARLLAFDQPSSGERLQVEAEPPSDFEQLVGGLRGGALVHGRPARGADTVKTRGDDRRPWRQTRHRAQRIR